MEEEWKTDLINFNIWKNFYYQSRFNETRRIALASMRRIREKWPFRIALTDLPADS